MLPNLDFPVASNFHGSVAADTDMLSFVALVQPPFSMGYRFMSPLTVTLSNGSVIETAASTVRFSPYSGYRNSALGSSAVRPLFELPAVLVQLNFSQSANRTCTHFLSFYLHRMILAFTPFSFDIAVNSSQANLYAMLRQYAPSAWTWAYPVPVYPTDFPAFNYTLVNPAPKQHALLINDTQSAACGCVRSLEASFKPTLNGSNPPTLSWGAEQSITLIYTFDAVCSNAIELCNSFANPASFAAAWYSTAMLWEQRWQQAFTPNNTHYSGYLPELNANFDLERFVGFIIRIAIGFIFFNGLIYFLS